MGFSTPTLHSQWIRIGVDPLRMEYDMFTKLVQMCAIGALSLAVLGPAAVAQGFDGKKFFDELSTRGVSTGTLDPERFFEELRATGASAQNRLAHVYAQGVGVEKSQTEAAKWRLIAKAGGLDDPELDALVDKLPKAQQLAAQKAATEWREEAGLF